MNRLTPVVCVAVCLLANSAFAQLPPPQYPHLEMSFGFTSMTSGPGTSSERAMTTMGLSRGHENMTQTGIDGFWKVEIGTSKHRSLGLFTTRVTNHSYGYGEVPGAGYASVSTKHVVVTRAVTYSYRPNGWLSVGAGPALHLRRFAIHPPSGPHVGVLSKRSLGAVAGINVKWKREGGTFFHALWQYRYAGALKSETANLPIAARPGAVVQNVKWPATRIPFSHRMLGIGVGFEF